MGEIIVIYDPAKEVAALVDVDSRIGFGPAMIGPDAETALDAFLQSVAYDVTEVDSAVLRDWFEQFTGARFPAVAQPPVESDPVAASDVGDNSVDSAALAERTATESGPAPPEPQPADTDASANPSPADTVTDPDAGMPPPDAAPTPPGRTQEVNCPACNGSGQVPTSVEGQTAVCNLCHGSTKITVPV